MLTKQFILGIDIGSVSISFVEVSLNGDVINTAYEFHNGDIEGKLRTMLLNVTTGGLCGTAYTAGSPDLIRGAEVYDSKIAYIAAAKKNYDKVGSILTVGGEEFSLISFDNEGNYRNLMTSSSCAAGTGSFLDQQARRLNLSGSAELSRIAENNKSTPPEIASRCSVFARTDIIHAQQSGHTLEEICDGLCKGLANNITDTLFTDENIASPVLFTGGVAKNKAVAGYLEKRIGNTLLIPETAHLYGALGVSLLYLEDLEKTDLKKLKKSIAADNPVSLLKDDDEKKTYSHEPLSLKLSSYPDFPGLERYLFNATLLNKENPVEVDLYELFDTGNQYEVYLGIDIGSTSTKAVLLTEKGDVLAGLYTRTAGMPIKAVQALLETIDDISKGKKCSFKIKAAGTTGSGRRFIGEIIGADIMLDEITAHARAAYELDNKIDTIIEIGGQDAKFTLMRDGLVTFSQMNTVCAAGTGSFIEEQAVKLNVSLSEFSDRAEGVNAPLVSDCCTVFMERDINHFLNKNYQVNEILAASLFAVRENYLLKVASEGNIGEHICFQGATAKNKALVAAFEQKLKKPLFVSKYCHITGALGVALSLVEEKQTKSTFRGIGIYKEEITVRTETCMLCNNRCRIRIAKVENEEVAYGFLCGRDYSTEKFVNKNKSGFDLLKERRNIFSFTHKHNTDSEAKTKVVGIPAALHLLEELPFWEYFFNELSIPVVTSEKFTGAIKLGKKFAGAEFCAPMNAFHGHVRYLSDKADYLFLPIYIESWMNNHNQSKTEKSIKRKYCYYTQFSSSLISVIEENENGIKSLLPLIGQKKSVLLVKYELIKVLKDILPAGFSLIDVSKAYDNAVTFFNTGKKSLIDLYNRNDKKNDDIKVVFTGRPYSVLSPSMNKGIPDIFASLGVKTFFQDMIPPQSSGKTEIAPLLNAFHWKYAADILETAEICTNTEGLYPVFITSFKCAPDSFAVEYFKRILDSKGKPYLILQLDEHDSNVGYETRIEAGVRSFRNHAGSSKRKRGKVLKKAKEKGQRVLPVNPILEEGLSDKTLLFPNWDYIAAPFLVANLRRAGIDARLLEEDKSLIRKSMRFNTGQCIPINAITEEYIAYIKKYNLDPEKSVLWMIKSGWACNIKLYPYYIKSLLESYGKGMEKAGVYAGEMTYIDISPIVSIHAYFAFLFGGIIRKFGCQIRPYEVKKGETDRVIEKCIETFTSTFLGEHSYLESINTVLALFDSIEYKKTDRPKVAIFGDLYVRDNREMNQDLIRTIEASGGEVIITPYNEYVKIISTAFFKNLLLMGRYVEYAKFKPLLAAMELLEKRYFHHFEKYVGKMQNFRDINLESALSRFNIRVEQSGESVENLLKILHIMNEHPDVTLFVQTNPAFCCPSLITEAMKKNIEREIGVPIVTLTYDGTSREVNNLVIPYLKYPRKAESV